MAIFPGVPLMPVTLSNAMLGLAADRSVPVRGPDRIAVVSPMFEEEDGAGPALESLLMQRHPVDEIVISINGGTDATPEVVARTLRAAGYDEDGPASFAPSDATVQRWSHAPGGPRVTVLEYPEPISKAASVNAAVAGGHVEAERVLVVDGDTRFDLDFVRELRDSFYRLRLETAGGRRRYVLEDVALQSGAARSLLPGPGRPVAAAISRARTAEYGLACLVRRGQAHRMGRGRTFGSSRMYTVVGCGFTARRNVFPIPSGTQTEDHDFTLAVQNAAHEEAHVDPHTLHHRGFRIVVDGREVSPRAFFDPQDEIVLRRSADVRFVPGALMYTEDPPRLGSYVRQVERWTGGGIENALGRLVAPAGWGTLRPNVRFAAYASMLENLYGLSLLLLIPAALGLHAASPGTGGISPRWLGVFFAVDFVLTFLLVGIGLAQMERAQGTRGLRVARRAVASASAGVVPHFLLKYLNMLCFLAAATKVVPSFVARRGARAGGSGTWVRPRVMQGVRTYTSVLGVGAFMVATGIGSFLGMAELGSLARPGYADAWRRIHEGLRIEQDDHRDLPVRSFIAVVDGAFPAAGVEPFPVLAEAAPAASPFGPLDIPSPPVDAGRLGRDPAEPGLLPAVARRVGEGEPEPEPDGLSAYCRPAWVAEPAAAPRTLDEGAPAYAPLNDWQLLVLARLVPLAAHLEEAATAYDVDPGLLLTILLNESYLDPLAVGPTDDLGLSQVTSDALTLLHSLANDSGSPFANERLFGSPFNVFDPDFSLCAGAAKLAWSRSQEGGGDDEKAYARYINPLHGVVRGRVSDTHVPLVQAIHELAPLTDALRAAFAAHREDPASLAPRERPFLAVSDAVAAGRLDIVGAYRRTAELVRERGIEDQALYEDVLDRLFDLPEETFAEAAGAAGG